MFYGDSVSDTRKIFFESWGKYITKKPLEPVEQQIVDVIIDHPEYHQMLEKKVNDDTAYFPEFGETNPFLHMGLHIAIREQVSTNRPAGITLVYQQLVRQKSSNLEAEHAMMECLAESLWQAQRSSSMPNESEYLACCQRLLSA